MKLFLSSWRRAARVGALAVAILLSLTATSALAEPVFEVTGRGYGHGIGMSQWGAQGYASKAGKPYSWILAHYYPGTGLVQRYTSNGPIAKVNLDSVASSRELWVVSSGHSTSMIRFFGTTGSGTYLGTAARYAITASGETVYVSDAVLDGGGWRAGTRRATFEGGVRAVATTPSATVKDPVETSRPLPALVQIVTPSGPFGRTNVRWRGSVTFDSNGAGRTRAINNVRLEEYLFGVVPRESPSSWHAEALKAQATAARSYAYPSVSRGSVLYSTTMSQVYHGHSRRSSTGDGTAELHETATTRAAIRDTRGELVVSGSEVVTTYFFASSGNHTANIEDVWPAATPKPYYRGVPDEYEAAVTPVSGYPWTRSWGDPLSIGASSLGAKLRDKGYGVSSATAIPMSAVAEKAPSGHARSVSVTWSNGQRTSVPGDRFRSWYGLKSTRFSIGGGRAFGRYQETDKRLLFSGLWSGSADTRMSGGAQRYSTSRDSTMRVRFKGEAVRWIATRSAISGRAEVKLDGIVVGTVDLYAATPQFRRSVFSRSGLSAGVHTLDITVLGTKSAGSAGTRVSFDAVDVPGGELLAQRFEDSNDHISYLGPWDIYALPGLSEGSYHASVTQDAAANVGFTGTNIVWYTRKGPAYGKADVWLDGVWTRRVDLYSESVNPQTAVFSASGLKPGRHLLRIRVLRQNNPSSTNFHVGIDAFNIVGGRLVDPMPVRSQQTAGLLRYSGTWTGRTDPRLSGGSYRTASSAGASVKFRVRGTYVAWLTSKRPTHGKAEVFVDGVSQGIVDLYAPSVAYRSVVWKKTFSTDEVRTVEIRVLHAKNPGSGGYLVGMDAIDVLGELRPLP